MSTPYISNNEAKKRQNVVMDSSPEIIESKRDDSINITIDIETTEPHHLSSFHKFKDKNDPSPKNEQEKAKQRYLDSQNDIKSRSTKLTPHRAPYRNSTNHQSSKNLERSKSNHSESFVKSKGSKSTRPSTAYGLNNQSQSDVRSLTKTKSSKRKLSRQRVKSPDKSTKQKEAERDLQLKLIT